MRKPDPELYRIMLGLMDLPGEACVFVDDTARNLPPAEELGIAAILAENPADTIAQMEAVLGIPLTEQVPGRGIPRPGGPGAGVRGAGGARRQER